MKIIKSNIPEFVKLAAAAALLFVSGNFNGDEIDKKQNNVKAEEKVPDGSKKTQTGKDRDKETTAFKPTEEVSADQAVAFPTDI